MRTQREFLEALKQERNGWELDGEGIRRGDDGACPLTAVAKSVVGKTFGIGWFEEAAEAMGMPALLTGRIVEAADNLDMERRLRKRILAALGLEEATR